MSDFALFPLMIITLVALVILSSGVMLCVMANRMGPNPSEAQRKAFEVMHDAYKQSTEAIVELMRMPTRWIK